MGRNVHSAKRGLKTPCLVLKVSKKTQVGVPVISTPNPGAATPSLFTQTIFTEHCSMCQALCQVLEYKGGQESCCPCHMELTA